MKKKERGMKSFYEISKLPIITGAVAALLFCVDSLLSPLLGGRFMWVAFAVWTVFSVTNFKDKIRAFIGIPIGFLVAVGMIYFGKLFDTEIIGIGIASCIGVFLFNMLVMYFDNFKKIWLNSLAGIFAGVFLTFSGLGIGLFPDSLSNAGWMLGVLMLYGFLGLLCAHGSTFFYKKWKKKETEIPEADKNESKEK